MKVFVAGASGVIGRPLVGMLLEGGHEVTGMTRSAKRADELRARGAEAVVADALDPAAVTEAVVAARPEAVIHQLTALPSRINPRKYQEALAPTNRLRREGTGNLVAASRKAGASRLLAQSVAFVYAPQGGWVKEEDAPLALDAAPPLDATVAAVADLEGQVLGAGGIVLRYGYFYGPGTHFSSDGSFAVLARRRQFPVIGSGEGYWSFIHVDDAAAATLAALERASPGVYNVTDDDPAPAREWLPVFAASVGAKPPRKVPAWLVGLSPARVIVSGMTTQRGASNAKARRDLGWSPRYASWRDGFQAAADSAH